jgi:hypothetical protein
MAKYKENVKMEKLLQIMCFQSQVLEFFYLGRAVTALHSLHYQQQAENVTALLPR